MNKNIFSLIFVMLIICLSACVEENNPIDCIDQVLEEGNYTLYDGQDFDCCAGSLLLYELDENQYFVYDNCCADLAFNAIDCDGNSICEDITDNECVSAFLQNATLIGIIGFQE